jgi:hypothetical protein
MYESGIVGRVFCCSVVMSDAMCIVMFIVEL